MKNALSRPTIPPVHMQPLLLIPAFGLLLIAALWFAVLSQVADEERSVLAAGMSDTEAFVASFEQHTLASIRNADRTLLLMKYEMERSGKVDLRQMLSKGLIRTDGFILIGVFDKTGRIVTSNIEFNVDTYVSDQEYFRNHAARDTGTVDISKPEIGRLSGKLTIPLSRRLNASDGSFAGVVVVAVSPAYFTDFYQDASLGTRGSLGLLGLDGEYRARRSGSSASAAPGANNARVLGQAKLSPVGSFHGVSPVDDVPRLVAYRQLTDYPLLLIAAQARDELLIDFRQRRARDLMTTAAATVIILLFFVVTTFLVLRLKRKEVALRSQRGFLQTVLDKIPMGITVRSLVPSAYGKFVVWNAANTALFDMPRDAVLGRTVAEVRPPETAARIEEWDRQMLAKPAVQDLVETSKSRDGENRVLHRVRAPMLGADGTVEYIVTIVKDITAERTAADKVRLASQVFETTADGIILSDADDRVIMVNSAFTRLTGFTADDMLGKPLLESPFRPLDLIASAVQMEQLHRGGHVTGEVQRFRKDGRELSLWITATCVCDDGGAIVNYVRVFTDISPLKKAHRELEQLANFDALTGLPNRRLFADRLGQALHRAKRSAASVGLLFLDLDGFKDVNDTYGHDIGDLLLKEVAVRLQACVRTTDSLCRLGGDEFTVILEGANLREHAGQVAKRIVQALSEPLVINGSTLHVGASIGIALSPSHGSDSPTLLSHADSAMYQAKGAGGNRFWYSEPPANAAIRRRRHLQICKPPPVQ
ncbi:MAG: diguanylate cyclase [Betaproteobacteria bacterium]